MLSAEAHLLTLFGSSGGFQGILHLLLHLALVRLLGVDHLVEVDSQESQHNARKGHHTELEDALVVPIKERVGQRGQRQKANAKAQAQRKAHGGPNVDLAAELVELRWLDEAIISHLDKELHDDRQNNDDLQALPEEDNEGRNGEVDVGGRQARGRHGDVVPQTRGLVHAITDLGPLHVPIDLRTAHVRETRMAGFVFFVKAAPLADFAGCVGQCELRVGQAKACAEQQDTGRERHTKAEWENR
mmetsp:Transcript_10730/g.20177  ORF Transcript_10730/g.20177 Transcript_10730/m.20177 type:complete len:244 (+) Transcript_10730:739-1470(+)